MKVLLQHIESGDYLKEIGVMTHDAEDAMEFLSSTQAIEFCSSKKIVGMQIVLRFDEHHYDIVLPMALSRHSLFHTRAPHRASQAA